MKKKELIEYIKKISIKDIFLEFKGNSVHLEQEFIEDYLSNSAKYTRFSIILGLFFYSIFGVLDVLIIPEQKNSLWLIRFAIVDPILIILLICSFSKRFKKYVEAFGVIALIVAGSGISFMVAIAAPPANYSYYSGILLVLMLGYGIVRIRFKWAAFAGWINVLIYEVISIFIIQTPEEILLNNNFFFISANLIGMLSCYTIEYIIRKNFLFSRLLEIEKENVKKLNSNLETMVDERTAELVDVNWALQTEIDARNIAEEKRKALEQDLFQAQKMESIGTLAGGIAHDFNNILSSLMGFTELSLQIVDDESDLQKYLQTIYQSGERAAELVSQILSFARKSEKKNEALRPDIILKEVLKFIHSTIPSNIEIKQSIKCDSLIMGNPTQIHQIFMNLCTNASYSMSDEGGILEIRMDEREINTNNLENESLQPGRYIQIDISDTGRGIPPEIIDSIFEPYFTTKKTGEGTGLGLAVVQGIIESCGGNIKVESSIGKGTLFTIRIPTCDNSIKLKELTTKSIPGGNERILLIDDEQSIAACGKLILSNLGYTVTCMTNSQEALNLFKERPDNYDLVVTDMMMPQLNGDQLADKINQINEALPIIICSGYYKDQLKVQKGRKRSFLNKPYTTSEIALEIRKALE